MTRAIKTMRCTLIPNVGIRATSCIRDTRTTMTTMLGILEAWIYNGKCISAPAHIRAKEGNNEDRT